MGTSATDRLIRCPLNKGFTVRSFALRQKKCKDQEKFLTKEAERLQNLVDSQSTPEHINEHMTVSSKLEKMSFDRSRGACIRSKARWHEFGERSSKSFFNLEKRNHENKCITNNLKRNNGSSVSDRVQICAEFSEKQISRDRRSNS